MEKEVRYTQKMKCGDVDHLGRKIAFFRQVEFVLNPPKMGVNIEYRYQREDGEFETERGYLPISMLENKALMPKECRMCKHALEKTFFSIPDNMLIGEILSSRMSELLEKRAVDYLFNKYALDEIKKIIPSANKIHEGE